MENRNAMKVIVEEGKQEVIIIREFDAPADLVFKAFTTPEILTTFFAPPGSTMGFHYHDYRSDGRYSWYNKDKNGKVLCTFNGVIHELAPPSRLVQTAEFMELPDRGHVVMEKMLFETLPGERTKLTIHDVCFSVADRDAMVQSGMAKGLEVIFDRLDVVLPTL
jgi:uncharacterized protein YndB with AHSA1/START domain